MISFYKMLCQHEGPGKEVGDCLRTAIACMLGRKPQEFPHFLQEFMEMPEALRESYGGKVDNYIREFLRAEGFYYTLTPFKGALKSVMQNQADLNPGMHYIMGGNTPDGFGHVVICCDEKFIWDPSPRNLFITDPMDDGCYWLQHFTTAAFLAPQKELQ